MKYLLVLAAFALTACNTFNAAVDGSQMIVDSTVDSAQSMVTDTAKGIGAGSATFVDGIAADIRKASEQMLAEIAAANAAFKVIKTALSNGKELYDCSDAAKQYFDNKSAIAKRVASKGKSDLDAFMALEKIKEQEEWLKDYMVYAGRANLYSDWLVFQSECKKKREQEVRIQALKRHNTLTLIKQFITVIGVGIAVIPVLVYGLIFLLKK